MGGPQICSAPNEKNIMYYQCRALLFIFFTVVDQDWLKVVFFTGSVSGLVESCVFLPVVYQDWLKVAFFYR